MHNCIPDKLDFKVSLLVKNITNTYKVNAKTNTAKTRALEMQPINNL